MKKFASWEVRDAANMRVVWSSDARWAPGPAAQAAKNAARADKQGRFIVFHNGERFVDLPNGWTGKEWRFGQEWSW